MPTWCPARRRSWCLARSEHADAILAWMQQSPFSRGWVPEAGQPQDVLTGWMRDPDTSCWVVEDDGVPVAYGTIWDDPKEGEAELAHLVVDPARRGRGHGRALVLALAQIAARPGRRVVLRIDPHNDRALAVYVSCHFAILSDAEQEQFNAQQPQLWLARQPAGQASSTPTR
ncbi:MAG: GNAT family N-acetyltransferase [Tetrasphaera sp.]